MSADEAFEKSSLQNELEELRSRDESEAKTKVKFFDFFADLSEFRLT